MNTTKVWLNVPSGGNFDWLVISDLTALCDIISVYIEAFLREREKGKRYYREGEKVTKHDFTYISIGERSSGSLH